MSDLDNNMMIDIVDASDWTPVDSMIKVIGVGGGGCNAVSYMFREKVEGCSFIVCNTDQQSLSNSPVPVKIHIGNNSRGAGTDPVKGRNAALEAQSDIEKIAMGEETQMLFITAGMGGGTGTGAAPIIAKMAKDKGILTVAVVTIPGENEGSAAMGRAIDGIHELTKNVDSLLIINNDKLYEYFGQQLIHEAFPMADEVLATAVRGITEIISKPGYINVDFEDVKTMMKESGMALMGCGTGTGENRINDAVEGALKSPLLNDFDLKTAKSILLNITCGKNEKGLTMKDLSIINEKVDEFIGNKVTRFKTGIVWVMDESIGDEVKITAIATGFNIHEFSKIDRGDIGNLITIGKDFKYERRTQAVESQGEAGLFDTTIGVNVISFNGPDNVKRFQFTDDEKPCLAVKNGESISELENIPAIKRMSRQEKSV